MVAAFLVCELPDSNTSDRGDWFSVYCRHESCRPFSPLFLKGSGFLPGAATAGSLRREERGRRRSGIRHAGLAAAEIAAPGSGNRLMQGSFGQMDPKRDNRFETKSSHKGAKAQRTGGNHESTKTRKRQSLRHEKLTQRRKGTKDGRESRKHENTKKTIASTRKAHTKAQRHKGREGITKARKHEKDNRFDTKSSHKGAKAQRTGGNHESTKTRKETIALRRKARTKAQRETVFSVQFSAFNGKLNTEN